MQIRFKNWKSLLVWAVFSSLQSMIKEIASSKAMKLLAGKTWYTVKPGEAHPRFWRFHKWIYYLKVEPLCCHNQYKIQICTPACLISSEFFTISHCLYSVSIEWTKFSEFESDMKLHNYIPSVCAVRWSLHMPECRDKSEIRNHRRIQVSNNKFLDGIFRGRSRTWLD